MQWFIKFVEVIFSLGLIFNIVLFIPQAFKLVKNKDSRELSLITFLGFNVMQFFTMLHGYFVKDYILMFGFGMSFVTCGIVTFLIIKYR